MTHHITATFSHGIDGNTGRVESKPRATFTGHDDVAFEFLHRTVRGYRGPTHPHVTVPYARKIQALAAAAGFKVTVKENPKPTPAEACDTIKTAQRWLRAQMDPYATARATAATIAHFKNGGKS
jgi:hypothetical protein